MLAISFIWVYTYIIRLSKEDKEHEGLDKGS